MKNKEGLLGDFQKFVMSLLVSTSAGTVTTRFCSWKYSIEYSLGTADSLSNWNCISRAVVLTSAAPKKEAQFIYPFYLAITSKIWQHLGYESFIILTGNKTLWKTDSILKYIGQCSKVGIPKSGHTVKKWAHHLFPAKNQRMNISNDRKNFTLLKISVWWFQGALMRPSKSVSIRVSVFFNNFLTQKIQI